MEEQEKKQWYEGIEERVVQAYKETGIRPQQATWAACALGVCSIQQGTPIADNEDGSPEANAAEMMGASINEINAFIDGFDESKTEWKDTAAYNAGVRTWEAVKAAGLVSES